MRFLVELSFLPRTWFFIASKIFSLDGLDRCGWDTGPVDVWGGYFGGLCLNQLILSMPVSYPPSKAQCDSGGKYQYQ
jgi:hypothetical protein